MKFSWILLIPMVLLVGCTSSEIPEKPSVPEGWDGSVQQWGTLRQVMHGEIMDGQVRLSDALNEPHSYGIGAPDKLHGEIIIADGVAWVAKIGEGDRIQTRTSSAEDSAVFLAVAQVPEWTELKVEQDMTAEEFDDFIQKAIKDAGLEKLDTVPFVIEGQFPSLKLHVLNGECPFAEVKSHVEGAGPPHRTTLNDVQGLLVGFYAEKGAGRITHHWTRTHVHALVGTGDDRAAGHVDEVALKAGSTIRLPVSRSEGRK